MSHIVCEPPEGAAYPRVVFDTNEDRQTVTITVGEKCLEGLTYDELSALHGALFQLVNYDNTHEPSEPRGEQAGPEVPVG